MYGFLTDYGHQKDAGAVTMSMTLYQDDGQVVTFERGRGLRDGYSDDGSMYVVCAIHDPCDLGPGDYKYEVIAAIDNGDTVLRKSGSLRVVPADSNTTQTEEPPTDFDYFKRVLSYTKDEYPEPEVPVSVYESRLAICSECPLYQDDMCTECGCFMPVKAGLMVGDCPLDKWGQHVQD